jgi:hypothetical protein
MNIGWNRARMVERTDADKPDLRAMTVVAPKCHLALWAAINVMGRKTARHGNGAQFATEHFYC